MTNDGYQRKLLSQKRQVIETMLQQAQRRRRFLHPPPTDAQRRRRSQQYDSLNEESESDALDVHERAQQEQQEQQSQRGSARLHSRMLPRATARNVHVDPSLPPVTTAKHPRQSPPRHANASSNIRSAMDVDHLHEHTQHDMDPATDAVVKTTPAPTTKRTMATESTAASPRVLSVTLTVGDWLGTRCSALDRSSFACCE